MSLRLYNTFTKREEEFRSLDEETGTLRLAPAGLAQGPNARKPCVRVYTCGPTVYGRPHIGNYASFLMADLLRRWLEVSGYEVLHVKNITDVGHIVADADSGEDKVEARARAERGEKAERLQAEDVLKVAQMYEKQFLEDERALNILEPLARPRATETIPEMLAIIRKLLEKGHAYETSDGIYFAVSSFPGYGKLSGNTLENLGKLAAGVRIEVKESKKHPADFALWKKCIGENAKHVLRWSFESGERLSGVGEDPAAGFPGWHIECSAMSTKYLGGEIDIHTGGEDNIFPHHECEIAQSEGAFGKPFVRYWLHRRRVNFGEEKMSKSLGNILTLPDIVAKGFHPLDLRYYLLSSHYRSHATFSWKGLTDAKKARSKVIEWMEEVQSWKESTFMHKEYKDDDQIGNVMRVRNFEMEFCDAMNADLNTPEAIAVIFDVISWSRQIQHWEPGSLAQLESLLSMFKKTFGCFQSEVESLPEIVRALVTEREKARRAGDYKHSDALRKEALKRGYILEDLAGGTKVIPCDRRS